MGRRSDTGSEPILYITPKWITMLFILLVIVLSDSGCLDLWARSELNISLPGMNDIKNRQPLQKWLSYIVGAERLELTTSRM